MSQTPTAAPSSADQCTHAIRHRFTLACMSCGQIAPPAAETLSECQSDFGPCDPHCGSCKHRIEEAAPSSASVPLSDEQKADLKTLADAATPGPWRSVWGEANPDSNSHDEKAIVTLSPQSDGYGDFVAGLIWYDGPHAGMTKEDAAYIAAAHPAAVSALLDENASLSAALAAERSRAEKAEAAYQDAAALLEMPEGGNIRTAAGAVVDKLCDWRERARGAEAALLQVREELAAARQSMMPLPFPANQPASTEEQYFCLCGGGEQPIVLLMWASPNSGLLADEEGADCWCEWDGTNYSPIGQHLVTAFWPHPTAGVSAPVEGSQPQEGGSHV